MNNSIDLEGTLFELELSHYSELLFEKSIRPPLTPPSHLPSFTSSHPHPIRHPRQRARPRGSGPPPAKIAPWSPRTLLNPSSPTLNIDTRPNEA